MVGLPVIDGIQRVAFSWRVSGNPGTAVNVMHFHTASTDTLALKTLIDSSVTSSMWFGVINNASVYQLAITPLDGSSATQLYAVGGAKWTGMVSGGDYLLNTAVVVSMRSLLRGRQNRGRSYTPFIAESYTNAGSVSGDLGTPQNAWDAFRAAMKAGNMPLHIASYGHGMRKTGGHGGPITYTPTTWTPHSNEVVTTTLERALGTMRMRQSRIR